MNNKDKANELNITGKALRSRFLAKAEKIMDLYLDDAINVTAENRTSSKESQKKIFDALIPILQSSGDIQKVEVESTASIIEMLKQGTLTFLEAKQLMDMLSIKSDMDDVKKLLEAVNQMNGNSIGNG